MYVKLSMDPSQIVMIATENESLYAKQRLHSQFSFFEDDNSVGLRDAKAAAYKEGTRQPLKEPKVDFTARATYKLDDLAKILKIAQDEGVSHATISMRTNSPICVSFMSNDQFNVENAPDKNLRSTRIYMACRVDTEDERYAQASNDELAWLRKENAALRKAMAEFKKMTDSLDSLTPPTTPATEKKQEAKGDANGKRKQ